MKVLIADGDELLLETLQSFLWDRGFEAEIAGNALECLTVLRAFEPDVLVLADELPWDGEGAIVRMQNLSTLTRIPVILLASCGAPAQLEGRESSPVIGSLHKPFPLSDLLVQLGSIDDEKRAVRHCATPNRRLAQSSASR